MKLINNDTIHELLMEKKPLLAYDENKDYAEWKAQIKEKYIQFLGLDTIAQNACPIKVEIEECVETEEYTRYRYIFESEKGCYVPCYLLIPREKKEKFPVCVCVQGHTTGFHISIGEKKYDELTEYLMTAICNLAKSGADFAALSANTPHIVFDRLKAQSPIPLISIV